MLRRFNQNAEAFYSKCFGVFKIRDGEKYFCDRMFCPSFLSVRRKGYVRKNTKYEKYPSKNQKHLTD